MLIVVTALLIGACTGTLTYLAGNRVADAVLAALAAFAAAIPVLDKLIG